MLILTLGVLIGLLVRPYLDDAIDIVFGYIGWGGE